MSDLPKTRVSLVLRLAEASDVQAWHEFADIYAPAIFRLALRKGLQPVDAEDVTQRVLLGVARAIERFSPDAERATFRTWLGRIARNLIADHFRKESRAPETSEVGSWLAAPVGESVDAEFELEHRRAMFEWAAARVQERVNDSTWSAFQITAVDNESAQAASERTGLSLGAVYVARSRVLKMLRLEVERIGDVASSDDVRGEEANP